MRTLLLVSITMAVACILAVAISIFVWWKRRAESPLKCSHRWCDRGQNMLHHLHQRANLILAIGESNDAALAELHEAFPNAQIVTSLSDRLLFGTVDLVILHETFEGDHLTLCSYVRPFGYILGPRESVLCENYCFVDSFVGLRRMNRSSSLYRRCNVSRPVDQSLRKRNTLVAINFASDSHLHLQMPCTRHLTTEFAADSVISYGPNDVEKLCNRHPDIMNIKRGAGLWSWKPYLILITMFATNADVILYCDSSTKMLWDRQKLLDALGGGDKFILAFQTGWKEADWTKRDIFHEFLGEDELSDVITSNQFEATVSAYKCNQVCLDFLKDWKDLCFKERLITDDDNVRGLPNFKGFQENRHDQSLYSLLVKTRYKAYVRDVPADKVYAHHHFG